MSIPASLEAGRAALKTGIKSARKARVRIEKLIADHPVRSLLIALGAGALLGLALRRRS